MSPQRIDVSNWPGREETCAHLGISPRTLDREVAAGRLNPRKNGKRLVFDPEEIAARMKPAAAQILTSPQSSPHSPDMAKLPAAPEMQLAAGIPSDLVTPVIMRLVEMVAEAARPPKTYIPLKEAADQTGLSHKFLRRQVYNGNLPAVRDIAIKVHRDDLEELDLSSEFVVKPKAKRKASRGK